MLDWLRKLLEAKAFKERHKVTQLKWKKAALQRKIDLAKEKRKKEEENLQASLYYIKALKY